MRIAFVKTLEKLAAKNKDIVLITGDLGFSVFEDYIKKLKSSYEYQIKRTKVSDL